MDTKLPYDLNIEIFSRTSLKSLDAVRCTSKAYNNLTYDSHLVEKHKERNNIVSGVFVQPDGHSKHPTKVFVPSHESDSLDLGFLPKDARILSSSNQGIILFDTPHPYIGYKKVLYYICKPTTKQVFRLPEPYNSKPKLVALIVVSSSPVLHYKIVRFYEHESL
ncbi:F-box associated domain containing protein, partial [Tanacetum coccineum]